MAITTPKRHAPRGPRLARDHTDMPDHTDGAEYVPCTATAKGSRKRCKRRPIPGGTVCVKHGGGAPQVQMAAKERLMAMQPKALRTIDALMGREEFPTVQLAASKAVIDWTEGRAKESLAVEMRGDATLIQALLAGRKRAADARKAPPNDTEPQAGD